jgi:hypothetical protein
MTLTEIDLSEKQGNRAYDESDAKETLLTVT